jgi:hypothetical protein
MPLIEVVCQKSKKIFRNNKKRLLRAALERGKRKEGVSSGKAMQDDEVEACARTTLVMESKNLEEG